MLAEILNLIIMHPTCDIKNATNCMTRLSTQGALEGLTVLQRDYGIVDANNTFDALNTVIGVQHGPVEEE